MPRPWYVCLRATWHIARNELVLLHRRPAPLVGPWLLGLAAVLMVALSLGSLAVGAAVQAVFLWLSILFACVAGGGGSHPQEGRGTDASLRFMAPLWSIWLGTLAARGLMNVVLTAALAGAYLLLMAPTVVDVALLVSALGAGCLGVTVAISLADALAGGRTGRGAWPSAMALPVALPSVLGALSATQAAFGVPRTGHATDLLLVVAYSVLLLVSGGWLVGRVWTP